MTPVPASVADLLTLAAALLGSVLVTIAGVAIELTALLNALSGEFTLAAWELAVGLLVLYVGAYLLGYRNAWQRLAAASAQRVQS